MATPAYADSKPLPAYADPSLPAPDQKCAPQSVWIQDNDISGLYRKRYILPLPAPTEQTPEPDTAAPPTYTSTPTPLYTVKSHPQHTSLNFRATQLPDFTIYLGDGDDGPVVATGNIHTPRTKKGLGEVRFFPRTSSNNGERSSPAGTERPSVVLKESGKKCTFTLDGQELEWEEAGPGEEAPAPAPPPPPPESTPVSTGFLAKLKRKSISAPAPPPTLSPRDTRMLVLISHDIKTGVKTKIATYIELQPIGSAMYTYKAVPPKYKDGHVARIDIHDPFFTFVGASSDAARELAVVTLVLLLEVGRRKVGRSSDRTWLGGMGGGAGMGGCGGGGP